MRFALNASPPSMDPISAHEQRAKVVVRLVIQLLFVEHTHVNMQFHIQGDSGGPLVYLDSANATVLIGIVSFGSASGCATAPSVFVRTTAYLDWISEKIGKDAQ
jgi:Trypsin